MASITKKMHGKSTVPLCELAEIVKRDLKAEFVSEVRRTFGDATVALLCFEKYFFRNGSYASLTILLTEEPSGHMADIIASGGGEGIFNSSLWANEDFANEAVMFLEPYGFCEV